MAATLCGLMSSLARSPRTHASWSRSLLALLRLAPPPPCHACPMHTPPFIGSTGYPLWVVAVSLAGISWPANGTAAIVFGAARQVVVEAGGYLYGVGGASALLRIREVFEQAKLGVGEQHLHDHCSLAVVVSGAGLVFKRHRPMVV
jgi:hypothetical protein